MIFTDEKGKIYEIPDTEFSKYEVSAERAKEIVQNVKDILVKTGKYTEAEVQGYGTGADLGNVMRNLYDEGFSPSVSGTRDFVCSLTRLC